MLRVDKTLLPLAADVDDGAGLRARAAASWPSPPLPARGAPPGDVTHPRPPRVRRPLRRLLKREPLRLAGGKSPCSARPVMRITGRGLCPSRRLEGEGRRLKRRETEGAAPQGQPPRRSKPPLARLDIMLTLCLLPAATGSAWCFGSAAPTAALSSRPPPPGGSPRQEQRPRQRRALRRPQGGLRARAPAPLVGAFACCARSPANGARDGRPEAEVEPAYMVLITYGTESII